ncbi:peptidyl-tRNA hydrolase ICT1, mitochondrial-like [Dendronephthya gigantea]|uniref:peptidyl-tRNA hydrolase ICT1, mitochondrial-like n=1 Tax=Dendronephthya gigantea TaxID=151771 RepID=UPI00106A6A3F|nr:peptidyl-tRNA hydrolase ICT1, mitochondrial-like [Dendronephthya gigantea]XP_028418250.1 peptidyl-tRNA hydrolase ICT1, mitochondrial-like [Dendronephthya gigantea]
MLKKFPVIAGFSKNVRVITWSLRRLLNDFRRNNDSDGNEKLEQFSGRIPIDSLIIKYSRSPGPGGQNVNKVNTKVDIRFHVMSAEWIPYWIRLKLLKEEDSRINRQGELVVQSSRFRNQQKNLMDGVEKVQEILKNVSIIPSETSEEKKAKINELMKSDNERRLKEKKLRSKRKQERFRNE